MATIGTFNEDGDEFKGNITTLTIMEKVSLKPTAKKSGNGPDYRVVKQNDFASEIGAAWKKCAKDGTEYLSVTLDDPSFADRINCRLIKNGEGQGYSLYWDRHRPRD